MSVASLLTDIADAIRAKTGGTEKLSLEEMANAIDSISAGVSDMEQQFINLLEGNEPVTAIPDGTTRLQPYALGFANVEITSIPESVSEIDSEAFYGCDSIFELTFKGKPDYISSGAFIDCYNLHIINVPWAEGEVENAPWGATDAVINYNYTG